jgi:hypothetical protein
VADATMTIGRLQVHRWPATDAAHPMLLERQAGPDSGSHIVEGALHQLFNELSKAQTIESVPSYAERVTAS